MRGEPKYRKENGFAKEDRRQLMGTYAQVGRKQSKGQIRRIDPKHIISALPVLGKKPIKTRRKTVIDGCAAEEEEEARKLPGGPAPAGTDDLMITIVCANPHVSLGLFPACKAYDRGDLEEWCQWFCGRCSWQHAHGSETPGTRSTTWSFPARRPLAQAAHHPWQPSSRQAQCWPILGTATAYPLGPAQLVSARRAPPDRRE